MMSGFEHEVEATPSDVEAVSSFEEDREALRIALAEALYCIDDPACHIEPKEGERRVLSKDGQLLYQPESGFPVPITAGELLTEGEWGNEYWLDPATVPPELRRKYLEARFSHKVALIRDREIVEEKLDNPLLDLAKRKAYEAIRIRLQEGALSDGELAEQMVHSFIEQVSIDVKGAGFSVLRASASDDVELHVDFAAQNC
jgi:hypothetical protein